MKKFLGVLLAFVVAFSCIALVACVDKKEETQGDVEVAVVTLDKNKAELEVGETLQLNATVSPDNATDKTVTWSTSAEAVATVENGKVTAVAAGTATITAKAGEKSASCEVTVIDYTAATLGEWQSDRTEPKEWTVSDGKITLTTSESPNNNWYSWQGRKAAVEMEAVSEWKVETTFELTGDVLARDGVRTSVWLNVQDAQGNILDWAIAQYFCDIKADEDAALVQNWQWWDSAYANEQGEVVGRFNNAEDLTPSEGTHALSVSFADGKITVSIDDQAIASYELKDAQGQPVTECKPAEVILQSYSYGEEYTVVFGVPVVKYIAD